MTADRTHYVYWVDDADGVSLYVGCTKLPVARYRAHMRGEDARGWFNLFPCTWRFRGPLPSRDAFELERREISERQPVFNVRHVRGRVGQPMKAAVAAYFAAHGLHYPVPVSR